MDQPYQPIDCEVHDQLLALATLRRPCALTVTQANGSNTVVSGVIEDVYTKTGAEYLKLRDGDTFRLDQITAIDGKALV